VIAAQLGSAAQPVLRELAGHPDAEVRLRVLELVGQFPHASLCSVVVSAFDDPERDNRVLAFHVLQYCATPDHLSDLVVAMDRELEPGMRASLVRTLGRVGGPAQRRLLRRHLEGARDDNVRHALFLALTRLGEAEARVEFTQLLAADSAHMRHGTMVDLIGYVEDCELAAHLGPALRDTRTIEITGPESTGYTFRVCDVAVFTMASLGIRFSFELPEGGFTTLDDTSVQEAVRIVDSMSVDAR